MGDNIHVALRVRPLNQRERNSDHGTCWEITDNSITLMPTVPLRGSQGTFSFDQVFGLKSTNEDVYAGVAKSIVLSTLDGFNGTIFAYGQTSSGKTYTMKGEPGNPGLIELAVNEIFRQVNQDVTRKYSLKVSYMEIYKERITDLLNPKAKDLNVRESLEKGIFVDNLTEIGVATGEEVMALMEVGEANRHIGETNMNERSSRSHTVFRTVIESSGIQSESSDKDQNIKCACLTLVDLAGSERISQTKSQGERRKEGAYINRSLLALSTVISKLSGGKDVHIPYRDSTLTRILQPSLGGNALTGIVCTITPATIHYEESLGSLNFSARAKRVQNKPVVNQMVSKETLLKRAQRDIYKLEGHIMEKDKTIHELRKVLMRLDANIQFDDLDAKENINPIHSGQKRDADWRGRSADSSLNESPISAGQDPSLTSLDSIAQTPVQPYRHRSRHKGSGKGNTGDQRSPSTNDLQRLQIALCDAEFRVDASQQQCDNLIIERDQLKNLLDEAVPRAASANDLMAKMEGDLAAMQAAHEVLIAQGKDALTAKEKDHERESEELNTQLRSITSECTSLSIRLDNALQQTVHDKQQIELLVGENANYLQEIKSSANATLQLKDELTKATNHIDDLQQRTTELQSDLAKRSFDLENTNQLLDRAKEECKETLHQLRSANIDQDRLRTEIDRMVSEERRREGEFEKEVREVRQLVVEGKDERERMAQEIVVLNKEKERELNDMMAAGQKERERLLVQLNNACNLQSKAEMEASDLMIRANKEEAVVRQIGSMLRDTIGDNREHTNIVDLVKALIKERNALKQDLNQMDQSLQRTQEELNLIGQWKKNVVISLTRLHEVLSPANQDLIATESDADWICGMLQDATMTIKTLQFQINQVPKTCSDCLELATKLAVLQQENRMVENDLCTLKNKMKTIQQEHVITLLALHAVEAELGDTQSEVDDSKVIRNRLESELDCVRHQLEELKIQIEYLEQEMQTANRQASERFETLLAKYHTNQSLLENTQLELQDLKVRPCAQCEKVKAQSERLEQIMHELQLELSTSQDLSYTLQQEQAITTTNYEALQQNHMTTSLKLDSLLEENRKITAFLDEKHLVVIELESQVAEVKEKLEISLEEVRELQVKEQYIKKELSVITLNKDSAMIRINELECHLEEIKREKEELVSRLDQAVAHTVPKDQSERERDLTNQLETLQAEHDATTEQAFAHFTDMETLISSLRSQVSQLEERLQTIQGEDGVRQQQIVSLERERDCAREDVDRLKEALAIKETALEESALGYGELKAMIGSVQDKDKLVHDLQNNLTNLKKVLAEKEDHVITNNNTSTSLTAEIDRLNALLGLNQDLINKLRQEVAKKNEALELLTNQKIKDGEEVATAMRDLATAREDGKKIVHAWEEAHNDAEKFKKELSCTQSALLRMEAQCRILEDDLRGVKIMRDKMQGEIGQKDSALKVALESTQQLNVKVNEAEVVAQKYREEIEVLNIKLLGVKRDALEYTRLTNEIEVLKHQLEDTKTLLKEAQNENIKIKEQQPAGLSLDNDEGRKRKHGTPSKENIGGLKASKDDIATPTGKESKRRKGEVPLANITNTANGITSLGKQGLKKDSQPGVIAKGLFGDSKENSKSFGFSTSINNNSLSSLLNSAIGHSGTTNNIRPPSIFGSQENSSIFGPGGVHKNDLGGPDQTKRLGNDDWVTTMIEGKRKKKMS